MIRLLFFLMRQWWFYAPIAVFGALLAVRTGKVLLRNRTPTEETCAGYAANRPTATWLRLSDCESRLDRIVVSTPKDKREHVYDVYVPFGEPDSDDVAIVVKMKDPAWRRVTARDRLDASRAQELRGLGRVTVLEGMLDYRSSDDDALRDVRNLVATGDAPILHEGERPSLRLFFFHLLLALGAGTAAVMIFRSR